MSLFREGLYFRNLEGSLLTVSYSIPEAVLTEYTRHRVLFLSQAGTYIDHLRREITLCYCIKRGPWEWAALAGHLS